MRYVLLCAVASIGALAQTSDWSRLMSQADTSERNGNYAQAARTYESALRLSKSFQPDDPRTPLTLDKLGMMYNELGRFSDAITMDRRAIAWVERWRGKNTEEYAALLNNLAAVYLDEDQIAKAEPLIREAVARDEAILQPNDPRLAKARSVFANAMLRRGDYGAAEQLLLKSIYCFENRPDCRRELGIAKNNLGIVRRFQERYEESRRLMEEGVAVIESDTGPAHPALARLLNNLASVYEKLGLREQANATYQRSIQIAETYFGPEHPQYGIMLHNYAYFLRNCGRKSEAKALEAHARAAIQAGARRNGEGMTVDVSAFRQK